MKCPVCVEKDLMMTDRQGIEVDYCPQCRGVWLDRGELDKLIQRAEPQGLDRSRDYSNESSRKSERDYREHRDDEYKGRSRKSFLRDLFD